ncbi:hypothetical protein BKA70DRAFT_1402124 [Coprinopsis sp. MPI-PUGE-AT-0042]|nr:hypothetical protein BKA70DRAFT_1402124 [Coprinopsis sp. MPI-PUGE-AT-0042]
MAHVVDLRDQIVFNQDLTLTFLLAASYSAAVLTTLPFQPALTRAQVLSVILRERWDGFTYGGAPEATIMGAVVMRTNSGWKEGAKLEKNSVEKGGVVTTVGAGGWTVTPVQKPILLSTVNHDGG